MLRKVLGPRSGHRIATLLPFVLLAGCQEAAESGNLRESYERMIASAERQAVAEPPAAFIVEDAPAPSAPAAPADVPATPPMALPIDVPLPAQPDPRPEPEPAPASEPEPPTAREPEPAAFEGTAGIQQRTRSGMSPQVLRAVRTAEHPGFDRVVFQFDGSMPGFHIEYIDRPVRECGSGRSLSVAGQGWLRVRLDPARAHELVDGFAQATVASRNRPVDHSTVLQLALTCDAEAQVEWVIGVASPNRYRILELTEPARLVVDVLH